MQHNFKHYAFDLDNTLYHASSEFFDLQLQKMSDFIQEKLNISRLEADFLRDDYYHSFGTTMHGLIHNHNIDPYEFLQVIDNIPLTRLTPNDQLLSMLQTLRRQGKHLSIFTNGSRFHAKRITERLKLNSVIDDVATLECTGLIPKPQKEAYLYFFDKFQIDPKEAVFFEDSSHNLIPAKKLGMSTVLVNADTTAHARFIAHPEIDYFVEDVESFLQGRYIEIR